MTLQSELKFLECDGCINRELDPLQCRGCKNGSNFDAGGDVEQELTYHEFIDFLRGAE